MNPKNYDQGKVTYLDPHRIRRDALNEQDAIEGSVAGAITLGPFVVDPALRAVRYREHVVNLSPRSFDLLYYLARNSHRVVTKAELLDRLWPEGATAHVLRQEIYSLRARLRQCGAANCIVTVSSLGYNLKHSTIGDGAAEPVRSAESLTAVHIRLLAVAAHLCGKWDSHSFQRARVWYAKANAIAPRTEALLGEARCNLELAMRSEIPAVGALEKSMERLNTALLMEPANVEARALLAKVKALTYAAAGRTEDIEVLHRDAGSAEICDANALIHRLIGDIEGALIQQRRAMSARPEHLPYHFNLALLLTRAGDYEAAANELIFLHKLEPQNNDVRGTLAAVDLFQAKYQEAEALLDEMPPTATTLASRFVTLYRRGMVDQAHGVLTELLDRERTSFISGYFIAKCYAAMGDAAAAVRWLRKADSEPQSLSLVHNPWFDEIRGSEVFEQFLRLRRA